MHFMHVAQISYQPAADRDINDEEVVLFMRMSSRRGHVIHRQGRLAAG
jgi:hypothetical protein